MNSAIRLQDFMIQTREFKHQQILTFLQSFQSWSPLVQNIYQSYILLEYPTDSLINSLYKDLCYFEENQYRLSQAEQVKLFESTQQQLHLLLEKEKLQKQQDEQEADALLASL